MTLSTSLRGPHWAPQSGTTTNAARSITRGPPPRARLPEALNQGQGYRCRRGAGGSSRMNHQAASLISRTTGPVDVGATTAS
jgi:hypothetical protein